MTAKENLEGWDLAIHEARERIKELKRSIQTFEEMRALGVDFPEPKEETVNETT